MGRYNVSPVIKLNTSVGKEASPFWIRSDSGAKSNKRKGLKETFK
jgi:hypothetical protein